MKKNISIILTMIMMLSICSAVSYASGYEPSSWAVESIDFAHKHDLISDESSEKSYTSSITRLEFCKIVLNYYLALNNTQPKEEFQSAFIDTDDKNVLYAADLGIITGRGDGIFSPDDNITRQEMATIIVRLLKICNNNTSISDLDTEHILSNYSDANELKDWAKSPVAFCLQEEIIKGMNENEIWPLYFTTREQAIVIIVRCFNRYADDSLQNTPTPSPTPSEIMSADVDYENLNVIVSDNIFLAKYDDRKVSINFNPKTKSDKYKIDIYLDQSSFWYTDEDIYVKTIYSDTNSFDIENIRVGKKYKINIYCDDEEENIINSSVYVEPKFTLEEKTKIVFDHGEINEEKDAIPLMKKIEVDVWKINKNGKKYSSTATVEVHKSIASITKSVFKEIYESGEAFPVKDVGGYSWRETMSSGRYSHHNYGTAIDINYNENYCIYKDGSTIGECYLPGENEYSIAPDSAVVSIFSKYGFIWGGDEWSNPNDYMHFSYLEL